MMQNQKRLRRLKLGRNTTRYPQLHQLLRDISCLEIDSKVRDEELADHRGSIDWSNNRHTTGMSRRICCLDRYSSCQKESQLFEISSCQALEASAVRSINEHSLLSQEKPRNKRTVLSCSCIKRSSSSSLASQPMSTQFGFFLRQQPCTVAHGKADCCYFPAGLFGVDRSFLCRNAGKPKHPSPQASGRSAANTKIVRWI